MNLTTMNENDFQSHLANHSKMKEYYSRLLDTSLLNVIDNPIPAHSTAIKKHKHTQSVSSTFVQNKSRTISSTNSYTTSKNSKTNKNNEPETKQVEEYKLVEGERITVVNVNQNHRSYYTTIPNVFRRFNVCIWMKN